MDAVTIFVVVLMVLAAAAIGIFVWRRPDRPPPRREPWSATPTATGARVVLDVTGVDPDDPAVERLVHDAALRALRADASVDHVEVVDRDGRVLGREERPKPLDEVAIPEELHEPHVRRSRGPSVVQRPEPHHPHPVGDGGEDVSVSALPLADRLELSPAIRSRVREPDRVTDVLRAILEAGGRTVQVDGDLLMTDDVAIAVVDARQEPERALTHGFLRIQSTSAPRGIVVRLGHVDPSVVRRREAAAPHVRHVAVDALQRMADAVAVGADPIAFAAAPPVRRR
ncbi:hypothetical protein [Egicoccus sp. AB-alg2]|uniref:hypothetical protein n=1 Tax=Egicoccus sp. AB-alg2 TaxID=3242693 RepID=UPI00359DAA76